MMIVPDGYMGCSLPLSRPDALTSLTSKAAASVSALSVKSTNWLLDKLPIKAGEACKLEYGRIGLLFKLAAPVPSAGQSPIDAGASIKEVVCASAIKGMPEKVGQDSMPAQGA